MRLRKEHVPGSIRSMHLEHVLRDVQTDCGSLLNGRLLWWQLDTATWHTDAVRGRPLHHPTEPFPPDVANGRYGGMTCHGSRLHPMDR